MNSREREKAEMDNPRRHDTTPAIKAAVEAVRILIEKES